MFQKGFSTAALVDEISISDGENTSTDTLLFSIDEGAGNAAVAANNVIPSIATMTEMSSSSVTGPSGCWRQRIPNMIITSSDEVNDEDDLYVPGWVGTSASMLRRHKRGNNASSGDEAEELELGVSNEGSRKQGKVIPPRK